MKVNNQVMKDFYSLGYEDAKIGLKLSEAYFTILAKAKKYVQTNLVEMNTIIDNNSKKIKSTEILLEVSSQAIKMWDKNMPNQRVLDGIDEVISTLKNEIPYIKKNINNLNQFITTNISDEIENIFGTLLKHYETGYLKYKNETENDQEPLSEGIRYSDLTKEIIDQYTRNIKIGMENLD